MRFSLRALVLGVLIAGLTGSVAFLAWENQGLRAIVKEQKEQLGELTVTDPKKIHLLRVQNLEDKWWRWKVYLPAGKYRFSWATRGITETNFPNAARMLDESKGETITLEAKIRTNAEGKWSVVIGVQKPSGSSDASSSADELGEALNSANLHYGDNGVHPPTARLELIRMRSYNLQTSPNGLKPTDEVPGLLVWIEPDGK